MPKQRIKACLTVLTVLLCAACARTPIDQADWPEELPPVHYYQGVYEQDHGNREAQSLESYLKWVRRFYEGWDMYPDGWLSTSRDILGGVEEAHKRSRLEAKLADLGKLISAEWAKSSEKRTIRSRELSVWGQALLKSVNNDDEEHLVDRVTADVNALLSGQLDPTDVDLKRYNSASTDVYRAD